MAQRQVRLGVVGVGRGRSMMQYCQRADNAKLVAICDNWEEGLNKARRDFGEGIGYYTSYDEFLKHDMDAVVLANFANEHAPFAIKAMHRGFHVISECLACQNMKEAVELVEAVEETGKIYCYAENCCYMEGPWEMKRRFDAGELGEFQYGEGEYIHNCETIWPEITHGDPNHWRNIDHCCFYCTHSIGPIIHITGLRPVSVSGFELPFSAQSYRMGRKSGIAGMEIITMENGSVIRSTHGNLKGDSTWFSVQGTKGAMETERYITENSNRVSRILTYLREEDDSYLTPKKECYDPKDSVYDKSGMSGHGGADYRTMWHCMETILGNPEADSIDVYEALDMTMPGMFGYYSVLDGNKPQQIPDLRDPAQREAWRNDTRCTDPYYGGDQVLPSNSHGNPDIPGEVYDRIRRMWEEKNTQK